MSPDDQLALNHAKSIDVHAEAAGLHGTEHIGNAFCFAPGLAIYYNLYSVNPR
jgi:hypothetical protein